MTRQPGWRRDLVIGGLVLLLCPPAGWPLALGYRREVARRLVEGRTPLLPGWSSWPSLLCSGLAAAAVILVYFAPCLSLFWALALSGWADAWSHASEIVWFLFLAPLLPPLTVPLLPLWYAYWFPWVQVTPTGWLCLGLLFAVTTFIMPAVFLQVSLYGGFRDARRLGNAIRFIWRCPVAYLRAWGISLAASAGVLVIPIAPWMIFWSYLVIVYAFNEALASWNDTTVVNRFKRSMLRQPAASGEESP
jgi:hypothetical protein